MRRGGTIVAAALTRGRIGVAGRATDVFEEDYEVLVDRGDEVAEIVAVKLTDKR